MDNKRKLPSKVFLTFTLLFLFGIFGFVPNIMSVQKNFLNTCDGCTIATAIYTAPKPVLKHVPYDGYCCGTIEAQSWCQPGGNLTECESKQCQPGNSQ